MDPLAQLGRALLARGYRFVTPTPETHRRVLRNQPRPARTLRDVFGWSKPYEPDLLDPELRALALPFRESGGTSAVRFSTIDDQLFAHSAYPTTAADSVFFGPDTYRFAALLAARVQRARAVVDVGCGSGAGGLSLRNRAESIQLLDINPVALRFARANAELNEVDASVCASDVLSAAAPPFDLVIANPPYLADDLGRAYRDGGAALGTALSARIAAEALERLQPGGRLILYTATPVVEGAHVLWPALEKVLRATTFDYRELDPDVFGEELDRPAYAGVERIAVVALDAVKR